MLEREKDCSIVVDAISRGELNLKVTHNDPKLNNILFDAETEKPVCVIDLDTIMPGTILYDFGDALRIGASTAAEDETNLDLVSFDEEIFIAFAKGYFEEMGEKGFRAAQVYKWVAAGCENFDDMSNISKPMSKEVKYKMQCFQVGHMMLCLYSIHFWLFHFGIVSGKYSVHIYFHR